VQELTGTFKDKEPQHYCINTINIITLLHMHLHFKETYQKHRVGKSCGLKKKTAHLGFVI